MKAAGKGHSSALNNIGEMYRLGEGVNQSFQTAIEWYNKATEQKSGIAYSNLAELHEAGQGFPIDTIKAIELYQKAVEFRYTPPLNKLYEYHVKKQNYSEAYKWLQVIKLYNEEITDIEIKKNLNSMLLEESTYNQRLTAVQRAEANLHAQYIWKKIQENR